jgi:dissimilatory sulfite reductase (desulfoviridin) alpha/beta subunit
VEPEVDVNTCTGCELCVAVCKRKARKIADGVAVIDRERCRNCSQCIAACPFNAIVEKRQGFAMLVGGREGRDTRLGEVIAEFLSEKEVLEISERCLKIMQENNTDAAVIIEEIGIEIFKKRLLQGVK